LKRIWRKTQRNDCFEQIASVIEEAYDSIAVFIGVHIDYDAIRKLQLELTLDDIKWALVNAPKLGIKSNNVTTITHKNRLRIYIDDADKFGKLKSLKRALPSVVVKVGLFSVFVPSVSVYQCAIRGIGITTYHPRYHQGGRKDSDQAIAV
jgi:hypothetical protein